MFNRPHLKVVTALVAASVFVSGACNGMDNKLQDAFASMTSPGYTDIQGAKAYNGTLRSGVDFGSGRIVSGTSPSNISLVNFTPPQITAGCGGIDFHLGGISWVNWDQFSALLDSVLMSAQYAVVNMALDWISEKLGSTFKAVINALMDATKMETDACKLGKQLAQRVADGLGMNEGDTGEAFCQESAQTDGKTDAYSTASSYCSDFHKMIEEKIAYVEDWKAQLGLGGLQNGNGSAIKKPSGDRDTSKPKACIGNCTWLTLRGAGFAPTLKFALDVDPGAATTDASVHAYLSGVALSELLMSGTGIRFGTGTEAGTSTPTGGGAIPRAGSQQAPVLPVKAFVSMFLCGTSYIAAPDANSLASFAATAGDATGDSGLKQQMINATIKDLTSVCQELAIPGSDASQLNVYECLPEATAASLAKAEGDYTGVNKSVYSALSGAFVGDAMRDAKDLCQTPMPVTLDKWAAQPYVTQTFLSEGLLSRNMRVMQNIFAKLIRGDTDLSVEEVNFVLSAPTPVYRMLSLAALFPSQGLQLIQSEAVMISALQAEAFIDRLITDAARNTDREIPVFEQDLAKVLDYLKDTSKVYGAVNVDVDKQLQRMTAFQAQVNVLQTAVMDSVYGHGLMGNMAFTSDIAKAATP